MDVQKEVARARALIDRGECAAALEGLHAVVSTAPGNVDALNLLGLALHRLGHLAEAIAIFRMALSTSAGHPIVLTNIGAALEAAGEPGQAELCYRMACARDPHASAAIFNIGRLCLQRKSYAGAEHHFRQAAKDPETRADALLALGETYLRIGRHRDSELTFRQLGETVPDSPDALVGIATAIQAQGNAASNDEVIRLCRRACEVAPGDPRPWNLLGIVSQAIDPLEVAEQHYREALRRDPDHAGAQSNLGLLLTQLGHHEEAGRLLVSAATATPDSVECANNLGVLRLEEWRVVDAIEQLSAFTSGRPARESVPALRTLGTALCRAARIPEALQTLAQVVALQPEDPIAHDNLLMTLLYSDLVSPELILSRHREYSVFFELTRAARRPPAIRDATANLRIGFVSADFRRHAVARFLLDVLPELGRQGCTTIAYSNTAVEDEVTEEIVRRIDEWRNIRSLSDREAAALVARDQIDILVDLAGHTGDNRLGTFALRPAPVQATWLGYPATTGLSAMDWRIVDDLTDPPGSENWHSERLFRLGRAFLAFAPPAGDFDLPAQRRERPFTFGCFNTLAKISETCRDLWAEVLRNVPGSRLQLKSGALADRRTWDEVRQWFAGRGIAPERIVIAPWTLSEDEHFGQYNDIDIALDPLPYNGTTTTCEALWMGVPVLSLEGGMHHARVGASLLVRAGLGDWVAKSTGEYVDIARRWAGRPTELAALKAGLRERFLASELCDAAGLARALAGAFRSMLAQAGQQPAPGVPTRSFDLPGGARIRVPDSLNHITRYVLEEQGDWFEDEIRFLRMTCRPDTKMIDVGANYGVYTLSMAALNVATGRIVAFEPAPQTFAVLAASVADNAFAHVRCVEAAASEHAGEASMHLSGNSELNQISTTPGGDTVATLPLDDMADDGPWDLVKIDAEGHESSVLRGGRRLFSEQSPLVMLEVRAGAGNPDYAALEILLGQGYAPYRLIPGLMVLAPVRLDDDLDPFCLNLFACKPDRAAILAGQGRLVGEPAAPRTQPSGTGNLAGDAIRRFQEANDTTLDVQRRYQALNDAWVVVTALVAARPTARHYSIFARIALAIGFRGQEVHALDQLLAFGTDDGPDEPTLLADGHPGSTPCTASFDRVRQAAGERLALAGTWSSYYMDPHDLSRLVELARKSPEPQPFEKRISLFNRRFLFSAPRS